MRRLVVVLGSSALLVLGGSRNETSAQEFPDPETYPGYQVRTAINACQVDAIRARIVAEPEGWARDPIMNVLVNTHTHEAFRRDEMGRLRYMSPAGKFLILDRDCQVLAGDPADLGFDAPARAADETTMICSAGNGGGGGAGDGGQGEGAESCVGAALLSSFFPLPTGVDEGGASFYVHHNDTGELDAVATGTTVENENTGDVLLGMVAAVGLPSGACFAGDLPGFDPSSQSPWDLYFDLDAGTAGGTAGVVPVIDPTLTGEAQMYAPCPFGFGCGGPPLPPPSPRQPGKPDPPPGRVQEEVLAPWWSDETEADTRSGQGETRWETGEHNQAAVIVDESIGGEELHMTTQLRAAIVDTTSPAEPDEGPAPAETPVPDDLGVDTTGDPTPYCYGDGFCIVPISSHGLGPFGGAIDWCDGGDCPLVADNDAAAFFTYDWMPELDLDQPGWTDPPPGEEGEGEGGGCLAINQQCGLIRCPPETTLDPATCSCGEAGGIGTDPGVPPIPPGGDIDAPVAELHRLLGEIETEARQYGRERQQGKDGTATMQSLELLVSQADQVASLIGTTYERERSPAEERAARVLVSEIRTLQATLDRAQRSSGSETRAAMQAVQRALSELQRSTDALRNTAARNQ